MNFPPLMMSQCIQIPDPEMVQEALAPPNIRMSLPPDSQFMKRNRISSMLYLKTPPSKKSSSQERVQLAKERNFSNMDRMLDDLMKKENRISTQEDLN
jgi:hypothetical protein